MRMVAFVAALAGVVVVPGAALACICGLVPTAYVCPACPTVSTSVSGCPVPTTVRRCYYEPRTTYRRVVQRVPQLTWAQQCIYDPIFGITRTILVPTVAYVEQEYEIPETTYVERCEYVEPRRKPSQPEAPPTEVLPEGATQRRYYYRPGEEQQPDAVGGKESGKGTGVSPEPSVVPPPPRPEGNGTGQGGSQPQPESPQSLRAPSPVRGAQVVHVKWRPVWNAKKAVASNREGR